MAPITSENSIRRPARRPAPGRRRLCRPIRELIEERTGRPVARGALYTWLDRLEAKGCLRSRMGEATEERGGKAKRYYSLTPAGLKAIRATPEALSNMTKGLEAILDRS